MVVARKEAKAAWTMAGYFEHLKFCSEKIASRRFFDKKVRLRRFDLQFKAEILKKLPIRNHRRGRGMTADLTIEPTFDLGDVLDVIDVAVVSSSNFRSTSRDWTQSQAPWGASKRIQPSGAETR